MPQVRIAWGRDKDDVKLYVFETEEQKAFFLKGVEAAAGWLEYEIKTKSRSLVMRKKHMVQGLTLVLGGTTDQGPGVSVVKV